MRSRLITRLNEGLHRKLTLVSAPAGFGKTTLISEWVGGCERPAAWLSLDEGDSEPTRFLTYLASALQTIDAVLGEGVLGALASPQPPPTEAILTELLNDIATFPTPFVLVLDDYHAVDARDVDDAVGFVLEHAPPQLHLVIATREDPPLPLARLRGRDQVTELRAADLRFTLPEAAEFLGRVMGLTLLADDIALLETRTEGWIAGLQLAALSVEGREDVPGFISAFAGDNRYVADYLVEEVLRRQPEEVRSFLLQTSILGRLTGPLCDAVTGGDDGGAMLEILERGNLFVVPLDDKRQWYRYHHLFADVLQARLVDEPERLHDLHGRASAWYDQNGLRAEAVRHALAARDFERSATLIELAWRTMDRTFQSATWLGWVKALPDALVRSRPVLSVGYAWSLLSGGRMDAAEARLQDAERCLAGSTAAGMEPGVTPFEMVVVDEEEFRSLPVTIASARAYRAQALGDVPATIEHASKALELLPEDDHLGRAIPNAILGLAYWASGDLEAAHRSLAGGMAGFQRTGNIMAAISGAFGLADMRVAQGRLREAIRTYEGALRLAREQAEPVVRGTAILHLGLSEVHRERGDVDAAAHHLAESEKRGKHDTQEVFWYRRCLAHARRKEVRGDQNGALALLDEAARLHERIHVPTMRPVAALKARIWLAQGRLAEALAWVREQGLSTQDDLSYLREFEHLTLARVLIARYENDRADRAVGEAFGLLERLLQAAERGERAGSVIDILVLQALARHAQGDLRAALERLDRAMALAEPEGYLRVFVDEGPPMATLLSEAAARGMRPDYVQTLLAAFDDELHEGETTLPPTPALPSPFEPLSERELEVLHLIAQGLSNREISTRLFRALSTVKGHNRNIFGKLQVRNRTEAVARARDLRLL